MNFSMHTNGKLLLTGEYFVTEGAVALALPTQLGQRLTVEVDEDNTHLLQWSSLDNEGNCWFQANFQLPNFEILESGGDDGHEDTAEKLQSILAAVRQLNNDFLCDDHAYKVETELEFPRDWGLGSSATLITMMAKWASVDAFELLEHTFGGSGYDIVTATAEGPVLFQKFNEKNRWDSAQFAPSFKNHLYFVHLNKKQNSRDALVYYMVTPEDERCAPIPRITQITHNINAYTDNLEDFEELLEEHELLVQGIVKQDRAKKTHFDDFWGQVKSLGAWGGDFVLVTSNRTEQETKEYFNNKGFATVLRYDELIK